MCFRVSSLKREDWVWPHHHKAQISGVLHWHLSFCRFLLYPHIIIELNYSDHQVLGHHTNQSISPSIARFGQEASSRKSPGCFKLLALTFNAAEIILYPTPDLCLDTILSWRSTDNSCMAWFVLWHALLTVGSYIDRCVPFQIMSNQLNLPEVDSSQAVETSQGWSVRTGCTWAPFWVSWQRLWIFILLFLINLQRFQTNLFQIVMRYCL